jgi:hypothetical protein
MYVVLILAVYFYLLVPLISIPCNVKKWINHTHSHMKYNVSLFMMYVMCHILQKDIK